MYTKQNRDKKEKVKEWCDEVHGKDPMKLRTLLITYWKYIRILKIQDQAYRKSHNILKIWFIELDHTASSIWAEAVT